MTDYSYLSALFVNCTLKRSPEVSNTQGLMDLSIEIMRRNGVAVESIRAIDHELATGVWPDMTEHGWERDEWPAIFERVMAADILVLGIRLRRRIVFRQARGERGGEAAREHVLAFGGIGRRGRRGYWRRRRLGCAQPQQAAKQHHRRKARCDPPRLDGGDG